MLMNFRRTPHKIHFLFQYCSLQEALSGVAFSGLLMTSLNVAYAAVI